MRGLKASVTAAELEAAIMKKLCEHPDCVGITHVYVKATGRAPPEDTWRHTLVSRRPNAPRSINETKSMHDVLNGLRQEFDLLPD